MSFLMFFADQLWCDDGRNEKNSTTCGILTALSALFASWFDAAAAGNKQNDVLHAKLDMVRELSKLGFLMADLKREQDRAQDRAHREQDRAQDRAHREQGVAALIELINERMPLPIVQPQAVNVGLLQANGAQANEAQAQAAARAQAAADAQAAARAQADAAAQAAAERKITEAVVQIRNAAGIFIHYAKANSIERHVNIISEAVDNIAQRLREIQDGLNQLLSLTVVNPQGVLAVDAIDETEKRQRRIRKYALRIRTYADADAVPRSGNRAKIVKAIQELGGAIQESADAIQSCVTTILTGPAIAANIDKYSKSLFLLKRDIYWTRFAIDELLNPDEYPPYEDDDTCVPTYAEWDYLQNFGYTRDARDRKITFVKL